MARILAVDDQRYFRELMEGFLRAEGHEAHTADGGARALQRLGSDDFDIVVADLVMPGMDGLQLIDALGRRDCAPDVIVVSGVADVKIAVEALQRGAADYLVKPFDREALAGSVERVLQRRCMRAEGTRLAERNLELEQALDLYRRALALFAADEGGPIEERVLEAECQVSRARSGVLWWLCASATGGLVRTAARGPVALAGLPERLSWADLGEGLEAALARGEAVYRARPSADGPGGRARLYLPHRDSGRLLGLSELSDWPEGTRFTERDRAAALQLAEWSACALRRPACGVGVAGELAPALAAALCERSVFDELCRAEIARCRRHGGSFSLLRVEPGGADPGPLGEVFTPDVLERLARGLRAGDRVAAIAPGALRVLLPSADALAASLLKQRVREALAGVSGQPPQADESAPMPPRVSIGAASFPGDAEDLESLDSVAEQRAEDERQSPVRGLVLTGAPFGEALDGLLRGAGVEAADMPERVVHFLLDELRRRPTDRGLLVLGPAPDRVAAADAGLTALAEAGVRTELVLICEDDPPPGELGPIRRVARRRLGTPRAFAVYFGEGSAYASVSSGAAGTEADVFFHTADRALVEHLALQLGRELSVSLAP